MHSKGQLKIWLANLIFFFFLCFDNKRDSLSKSFPSGHRMSMWHTGTDNSYTRQGAASAELLYLITELPPSPFWGCTAGGEERVPNTCAVLGSDSGWVTLRTSSNSSKYLLSPAKYEIRITEL